MNQKKHPQLKQTAKRKRREEKKNGELVNQYSGLSDDELFAMAEAQPNRMSNTAQLRYLRQLKAIRAVLTRRDTLAIEYANSRNLVSIDDFRSAIENVSESWLKVRLSHLMQQNLSKRLEYLSDDELTAAEQRFSSNSRLRTEIKQQMLRRLRKRMKCKSLEQLEHIATQTTGDYSEEEVTVAIELCSEEIRRMDAIADAERKRRERKKKRVAKKNSPKKYAHPEGIDDDFRPPRWV